MTVQQFQRTRLGIPSQLESGRCSSRMEAIHGALPRQGQARLSRSNEWRPAVHGHRLARQLLEGVHGLPYRRHCHPYLRLRDEHGVLPELHLVCRFQVWQTCLGH